MQLEAWPCVGTLTRYLPRLLYIAAAQTHTLLKAEVTPKRYAPWLSKAARWLSVVVLLDALTSTAKRLNLEFFCFLIKPGSRRGEMDSCCKKKRLGA